MHSILRILVLIFIPFLAMGNIPDPALKKMMSDDLDIIKHTFEIKYAPTEWKKKYAGWDLEEQIQLAKARIHSKENISIKDFQQIVRDFLKSTQDYHVNVHFYSTEYAMLPFRIQSAQNRYFITWVQDFQLPANVSFEEGDEIILWDGKPIHQIAAELKERELGNLNTPTDQALTEMFLPLRVGSLGHLVPSGEVSLTVKRVSSGKTVTQKLNWKYQPEKIDAPFSRSLKEGSVQGIGLSSHPFFQKKMATPLFEPLQAVLQEADEEDSQALLGNKIGFLPPLGKIIWKSSSDIPFYAYVFETSKHRHVGYIRVPSYYGAESDLEYFADLITLFESRTDALIIDQVNNPGGFVFYMYALASMLTDRPLVTPTERITIIQEDVAGALEILTLLEAIESDEEAQQTFGETLMGYPVSLDLVKGFIQHFQFILDEWSAGRTFTQSNYLYGIETIKPHPKAHYSKPLLLLINSLDFSCADFLPAILQDNKRATLFGTKTAGAGGFVLGTSYPNRFGIASYTYTGSIAARLDSNPIENLGVTPDIPYTIDAQDLCHGYRGYSAAIQKAVEKILKDQPKQ